MTLATITVYVIERDFCQAAYWSLAGAVLSWVGLMHSYKWKIADTVIWVEEQVVVGLWVICWLFCFSTFLGKQDNNTNNPKSV
jgi:hypothetical protein